jgi:hypothetical protein
LLFWAEKPVWAVAQSFDLVVWISHPPALGRDKCVNDQCSK